MIEISLKFFALGPKHFCSHWIEVVDAIVTIISLVVDALVIADHVAHVSHHGEGNSGIIDAFGAAAGLLIVFRMWRIVRILNGKLNLTLQFHHSTIIFDIPVSCLSQLIIFLSFRSHHNKKLRHQKMRIDKDKLATIMTCFNSHSSESITKTKLLKLRKLKSPTMYN